MSATTTMMGGALAAAIAIAPAAPGQSRQIPAPPQSEPIVIRGATVHTIAGPVHEPGFVRFENGVITAVGRGDGPADGQVINADGLHLYPGLISTDTNLGLVETGAVDVTHDHSELGDVTPEVRAAVAINPDTDLIPVTRANGILTALIRPGGGTVSGRASTIRLDGWTWEAMAIEPAAGLVVDWPSTGSRRGRWSMRRGGGGGDDGGDRYQRAVDRIEALFDDAAAYVAAREASPELPLDLRYEAMRPVLAGEQPIYMRASSRGEIESSVAWSRRRGLRLVIVGGNEADQVAPLLARYDVPVIVTGLHRLPSHRDDAFDEPFTLPARLYESGVRFAIASGSGAAHERNLNHNVATAVAFGLPFEAGLKSVTLWAADVIGLGESHGSLEPGKAATLIVTTGDPLQITTDTLVAFIDGRRVDLGNRHKSLFAKYSEKYRQLGLLDAEPLEATALGETALTAPGTTAAPASRGQ